MFTVPEHWRIRYRLTGNSFGLAVAQLSWTGVDEFGSHGFFAHQSDSFRTYVSADGAGSYRLALRQYAGAHWHIEVDALE